MADDYTISTDVRFNDNLTTFVRAKLLDALRAGLVHLPAGAVDFSSYQKGHTDTYRLPGIADLAPALPVHGDEIANPPIEDLESYLIEFSTTEYARSVGWSSKLERQQPFPFASMVADKVARDVQVAVDEIARAEWRRAHAGEVIMGVNTAEATTDLLVNAVAAMQSMDIPPLPSGYYGLIGSPFFVASLKREVGEKSWSGSQTAGDDAKETGIIARWHGVEFITSSRTLPAGAPATEEVAILTGANSLAFADLSSVQTHTVLPTPSIADPLGLRGVSSWIARLGAAVIARQVEQGSAATRYNFIKLKTKYVVPV